MISHDKLVKMFEDMDSEDEQQTPEEAVAQSSQTPDDLYQVAKDQQYNESQRSYPHGARQKASVESEPVLSRLRVAYKQAKHDSDILKSQGDITRARIVEQQYVNDYVLPAIGTMVVLNSPDEVLQNKELCKQLDQYASLLGNGFGAGYTESFIKSMYGDGRGSYSGLTDGVVRDRLRRLRLLSAHDQIRTAKGEAQKLLDEIDSGKHIASDEDYKLIQRVALR